MTANPTLRAVFAFLIFVLGNLQAWDSNVYEAGLLIVLLVSLAIPLSPIAVLLEIEQKYRIAALVSSFILLVVARLLSPIPLPELYIILLPAVMGLIFSGILKQNP